MEYHSLQKVTKRKKRTAKDTQVHIPTSHDRHKKSQQNPNGWQTSAQHREIHLNENSMMNIEEYLQNGNRLHRNNSSFMFARSVTNIFVCGVNTMCCCELIIHGPQCLV